MCCVLQYRLLTFLKILVIQQEQKLSLSADAAGVYLDALEKDVVRTELADEMLSYYFEDLERYEDLGIRKFNLSRWLGTQAAREYGERTF